MRVQHATACSILLMAAVYSSVSCAAPTVAPQGSVRHVGADIRPAIAPRHRGALPEVEKKGDGPVPMLIIPCMSCRWNAWEEFMERNVSRYRMYAVTLPGFGGTPVPDLPINTAATPWRDNALASLSRLLDEEALSDVLVVGHSYGTMIAIQLAALRPDVVTAVVAVDGSIESDSWTPDNRPEQLTQSRQVVEEWGKKLQDAEEWRTLNSVSLPPGDSVSRVDALSALKLHGSFMATPKNVVLQYWRENPLIDLTADLKRVSVPILDVQALYGSNQDSSRVQHLADLAAAGAPRNVTTIFMEDTRHHVQYHRPEALDSLIARFVEQL